MCEGDEARREEGGEVLGWAHVGRVARLVSAPTGRERGRKGKVIVRRERTARPARQPRSYEANTAMVIGQWRKGLGSVVRVITRRFKKRKKREARLATPRKTLSRSGINF